MAHRSGTVFDALCWKNISYSLLFATTCHTEEWVNIFVFCQSITAFMRKRSGTIYCHEKSQIQISSYSLRKTYLDSFICLVDCGQECALASRTLDILTLHLNIPHRTMKNREHLFEEICNAYRMSGYSTTCPCPITQWF